VHTVRRQLPYQLRHYIGRLCHMLCEPIRLGRECLPELRCLLRYLHCGHRYLLHVLPQWHQSSAKRRVRRWVPRRLFRGRGRVQGLRPLLQDLQRPRLHCLLDVQLGVWLHHRDIAHRQLCVVCCGHGVDRHRRVRSVRWRHLLGGHCVCLQVGRCHAGWGNLTSVRGLACMCHKEASSHHTVVCTASHRLHMQLARRIPMVANVEGGAVPFVRHARAGACTQACLLLSTALATIGIYAGSHTGLS
jgi:hypothetical protein